MISEIAKALFYSLLMSFVILFLMEQLWANSVSWYFGMDYFVPIFLFFGIWFLVYKSNFNENEEKLGSWFVVMMGIVAFAAVLFKTKELAFWEYTLPVIAFVLVLLFGLIINENGN